MFERVRSSLGRMYSLDLLGAVLLLILCVFRLAKTTALRHVTLHVILLWALVSTSCIVSDVV